jgi:hypothetical protein
MNTRNAEITLTLNRTLSMSKVEYICDCWIDFIVGELGYDLKDITLTVDPGKNRREALRDYIAKQFH